MTTVLLPNRCSKTHRIFQALKKHRPQTRAGLKNYLSAFMNLNVSDVKICPQHDSPLDYLWHSFSEEGFQTSEFRLQTSDFQTQDSKLITQDYNNDCIVWAGRGGGKTYLAAAATLLDSIFKPGCKTRILAGSQTQAQRMYDYLLGFVHSGFEEFLADEKKNKCVFTNGSNVEVMTQSMASVRGSHIHKLRCDEVELFKKPVFEAAKFITKSNNGVVASMESLSTMHQPFGIMHELVSKSAENKIRVFKWCIWEVIENCKDRLCSQCPLNSDCQGRAKQAGGYLKIDDVIAQMRRSSRAAFESEMLCLTPSLENVVFAEFEPKIHIAPVEYNPDLPLYRTLDFGFVNPFVCLWIQVDQRGTVRVIDEYIQSRRTIDAHIEQIKNRKPYSEKNVIMTFCDPAGVGVNDVTGTSPVSQLRKAGIKVRCRKSAILDGIELVRKALRTGDGKSSFAVNPRCGRLIEAMQSYHYPTSGSLEMPHKDGIYDHPIDALRYFFVNYQTANFVNSRRY